MRRALAAAVLSAATMGLGPATEEGAGPKALNLAACPAQGAEKNGTSRAALNAVKHRTPTDTTAKRLAFTDFFELQQQADGRVNSGTTVKVSATDRAAKLRGLTAGAQTVGEGDLVSVTGFIVGRSSANAGESANCYLTGAGNNDFEFSIAPAAKATAYEGIVGEMIPQNRPKEWTLNRLHKVSSDGRQVLVEGQLMFDTRHRPNPKKGTNHESPRFSTWEIHPVTSVLVCRTGATCDPAHADEWQPLASIPER
jgi:hypothetical protein